MDIGQLRSYFNDNEFLEGQVLENPYDQFESWFNDACRAKIEIPNNMILTTIDENGMPDSRNILLRKMERDGFSFFTRYDSNKALQIENNPKASLHFNWQELNRQVSISGTLHKTSVGESRKFFTSCNRAARLAARIPNIGDYSYETLTEKLAALDIQYDSAQIPMPDWWGGYLIKPVRFVFWQGRANYLHDRFEYSPDGGDAWTHRRISP